MEKKNELREKAGKIIKGLNYSLVAIFLVGFLMGILLKSQALKTVVSGYNDHLVFQSDEVTEDK